MLSLRRVSFRLLLVAALAGALAACAPRDGHVPDFAKRPFEPFSRSAAVEIALREWRLFGGVIAPADAETASAPAVSLERAQGLWQRVGEYWWLGLDGGQAGQAYTGLHDEQGRRFAPERDGAYAWSAAFVSYVMRMAGAGRRFPYAAAHADYVNAAARGAPGIVLRAEDPAVYAPQAGDLVCVVRAATPAMRYADLPAARFWGHCDIVVGHDGMRLDVVGGNVGDAVALRRLALLDDGRLAPAERPWLAVLRVLYDAP
ncbi:MAG: DUF2272 domain-containing protein [Alphaproteobacteria bacterium]